MSMPTIEELTDRWEAGYYEHFRNTGKSALDGRTAGVAAVRDAILDALIADAERLRAEASDDDEYISPWQEGVENIPLYHVTSDREYSEPIGDLVAKWLRDLKEDRA